MKQEIESARSIIPSMAKECQSTYSRDIFRWFSWINPIAEAKAQIKFSGYSENEIRGMVILSIFTCMGVYFFLVTGLLFFSKNTKVVTFAMDSVKTLLGFFIGVAASFMGVR